MQRIYSAQLGALNILARHFSLTTLTSGPWPPRSQRHRCGAHGVLGATKTALPGSRARCILPFDDPGVSGNADETTHCGAAPGARITWPATEPPMRPLLLPCTCGTLWKAPASSFPHSRDAYAPIGNNHRSVVTFLALGIGDLSDRDERRRPVALTGTAAPSATAKLHLTETTPHKAFPEREKKQLVREAATSSPHMKHSSKTEWISCKSLKSLSFLFVHKRSVAPLMSTQHSMLLEAEKRSAAIYR